MDAVCSEAEAAAVCTLVAAQIDARFAALDLSQGSRVDWPEIATGVSQATGRAWTPAMCQRVWRWVAYAEDVGPITSTLPDSDGEDEPPGALRESVPGTLPPTPSHEECSVIFDTWLGATAHSLLFSALTKASAPSPAQAVADEIREVVRSVLGFRPQRKRGFAAFHADAFSKGMIRTTFDARLNELRSSCAILRAELDEAKARAASAAVAAEAGDAAARDALPDLAAAVSATEGKLSDATRLHQEVASGGIPAVQDAMWQLLGPEEKRETERACLAEEARGLRDRRIADGKAVQLARLLGLEVQWLAAAYAARAGLPPGKALSRAALLRVMQATAGAAAASPSLPMRPHAIIAAASSAPAPAPAAVALLPQGVLTAEDEDALPPPATAATAAAAAAAPRRAARDLDFE